MSFATSNLATSVRAAQLARASRAATAANVDVLRFFAPHFHLYTTAAGGAASAVNSTAPPVRRRRLSQGNNAFALVKRTQHTQPHEGRRGSGPNIPPPSHTTASSRQQQQKVQESKVAGAPAYQTAGSTPPTGQSPSTSHISRVTPVSGAFGSELGSESNQLSTSQSELAEKEQRALEAREAEERWKSQPLAKRAWIKVKEEAQHYWHGTKLLAKEVRISARLMRRLVLGYNLTRREHRQLKRTTADLLRLIPFLPFIIIPFGELLLPVAIKVFPNMLPSTFESKFALEEKRRRVIKMRLEMAKFLQETIKEGGIAPADKVRTSDEFKEFFRKVRSTGEAPSPDDTIRVAKLFEDDLTLDNLTRPQLVSMCRYLQINAFGTDNYLRYQIRAKLNRIKTDDITISVEGVEGMSQHELLSACQNRGIPTMSSTEESLREELRQWIDLHVHQRISGILLILSKAFNYIAVSSDTEGNTQLKALELTLSSLPDNLLSEAELNVSKDAATNKQRLDVLQQQEELIEDEAEQEHAEEEARKADKERKRSQAQRARLSREEEEARAMLPKTETDPEHEDARMTNEQLGELGEALSILSAKSSVLHERAELAQLMKEMGTSEEVQSEDQPGATDAAAADAPGKDDVEETSERSAEETSKAAAQVSTSTNVSAASRSLAKRIKSMLQKIDEQLEEYDRDVGSRMNIIETSPSGKISVDDLEQALRLIKHRPEEEILERLVDKLDVDNDGLVPLKDVVELAQAESGLGILRDDSVKGIRAEGGALRGEGRGEEKPRREDIVEQ